jgi:hypothetical protein
MRKALLAVGGALLLAGCGSGGSGGHPATPTPTHSLNAQEMASLYRQLAQCVRAHGLPNFPDPVQNPRTGDWQMPQGTSKPPLNVMNACKSITNRLPQGKHDQPPSAADMAKLRELARCFREHGLADWPDPNADGAFPLPPRLTQLGKKGIMTQLQACKQQFPGSGIRVAPQGVPTHG